MNRALDALAEVLCQSRHRQQNVRLHLLDITRHILQRFELCASYLCRCYRCTTCYHDIEACNVCKAVVKRQDDEHSIVRRYRDTGQSLLDVCRIVAMSQDYTLRVCRCSRGISDSCVVIILNSLADSQELLAVLCEILFTHSIQLIKAHFALLECDIPPNNDMLKQRQLFADVANLRQLITRYEDCADIGMAQTEQQIVSLLQLDGEGYADCTRIEQSELRGNPCITALSQNRNGLFGLDAEGSKTCTGLQCHLACLTVCCRFKLTCCFFEEEGFFSKLLHR